jgi:hypothetical protein
MTVPYRRGGVYRCMWELIPILSQTCSVRSSVPRSCVLSDCCFTEWARLGTIHGATMIAKGNFLKWQSTVSCIVKGEQCVQYTLEPNLLRRRQCREDKSTANVADRSIVELIRWGRSTVRLNPPDRYRCPREDTPSLNRTPSTYGPTHLLIAICSSCRVDRMGMSGCIDVAVFCGAFICNVPTVARNVAGVLGIVGISIGTLGSHCQRECEVCTVGSEQTYDISNKK